MKWNEHNECPVNPARLQSIQLTSISLNSVKWSVCWIGVARPLWSLRLHSHSISLFISETTHRNEWEMRWVNDIVAPSLRQFNYIPWIEWLAAPCFLNRRLIHAALPFLLAQLKERTEMGCASVSSGTSLPSFMLHFGSSCLLHSVSPVPSSTHYIPSFRLPPFLCLVPLHSPSVHSVNSLTLCSFGNFRLLRALFS